MLSKSCNKQHVRPAALAAPMSCLIVTKQPSNECQSVMSKPVLSSYLPFIQKGHVSLLGGEEKVQITILRDTGALNSFILESVLPFSDENRHWFFHTCAGHGHVGFSSASA